MTQTPLTILLGPKFFLYRQDAHLQLHSGFASPSEIFTANFHAIRLGPLASRGEGVIRVADDVIKG